MESALGRGATFTIYLPRHEGRYDEKAALRGESLPPGTGFLEKPFTVEGLLQTVRAALEANSGTTP